MFEKLSEELFEISGGIKLEEALTKVEVKKMRDQLATPEILPCTFDITIPGWLWRIEKWGEISFYHKDPEDFRGKKKVTKKQFLDRIQDETLMKMFGQWTVEKKGLTKCIFYRDYIGLNDRHFRESFTIKVKLRKELR